MDEKEKPESAGADEIEAVETDAPHQDPIEAEPVHEEPPELARPDPEPVIAPPEPPTRITREEPRRGGGFSLLIALIALGVAAFALWQMWQMQHAPIDTQAQDAHAQERAALQQRIDQLAEGDAQTKREVAGIKQRLTDADSVNRSLREELLGVTERSRNLEDAISHLAEQRLTGRDALALNEAEFLLQLADERLSLFHDAQAAQSAYRLADSALAAAEDPVFASVRQTISAERQALAAAKPLQTQATLNSLERIRHALVALPTKASADAAANGADSKSPSRFMKLLSEFVRVRHDDSTAADFSARDASLARSLVGIDLRSAEADLLAGDQAGYTAALASARAGIVGVFASDSEAVKQQLAEIDRLSATPLAPALPELGSALRELRNLRNTRTLAQPGSSSSIKPATAPLLNPPAPQPVGPTVPSDTPPAAPDGNGNDA